jgi:hypothetical protein
MVVELTKDLQSGIEVIYDDKAKAIEKLRTGLYWRARKGF